VEGQRDFGLEEATIAELGSMLDEGSASARSLAEAYLERIEELDGSLDSVIEVNPDALDIADTMDRERREGRVRGPLHGIPVMVKDNIATADRMRTTAGSLAMMDARPSRDAAVVHRLRDAGAVLLAKTNLSEWANFRSERSSSGWSAVGGQCHNPYVLDRNPCGSSSGSAVVVAANLCAAAIGTETDGSIACPSSISGIVGIKPTHGLVDGDGIVPVSHTLDTAGPMARTVADAATMLAAIAGTAPSRAPVDYIIEGGSGQKLAASVREQDPVTLHLYGLDDGEQLAALSEHRKLWAGALPVSQDYVISVVPAEEGAGAPGAGGLHLRGRRRGGGSRTRG